MFTAADWMDAKLNTFHTAEIGGRTFIARLSMEGPYLKMLDKDSMYSGKGVSLGWATFIDKDGAANWGVFKSDDGELRLSLKDFTCEEIARLGAEFGIRIGNNTSTFVGSKAWDSLRTWVRKFPYVAESYARFDANIPYWLERASREKEDEREAA
ncbi:hypothetical protein OIU34_23230 [Pararhizobium sp. BT-229]|uniref:hypothetical protein n=1 Tax=Pararhizobium sp. BT-229 TaxID=2986923 RepID=UPI0021F7B657|nr:hypothetical protein [Pararhizobium sp. BT-229]MCV9964809.1 hypothetical protein [Pararhizobium sp. BT-229]